MAWTSFKFTVLHNYANDGIYPISATIAESPLIIRTDAIFVIDVSGSTSGVFAGDAIGDLNQLAGRVIGFFYGRVCVASLPPVNRTARAFPVHGLLLKSHRCFTRFGLDKELPLQAH